MAILDRLKDRPQTTRRTPSEISSPNRPCLNPANCLDLVSTTTNSLPGAGTVSAVSAEAGRFGRVRITTNLVQVDAVVTDKKGKGCH